jgi:hypothetical protein
VIFFLVKICYLPARFARRGIIVKIELDFELVSKNLGLKLLVDHRAGFGWWADGRMDGGKSCFKGKLSTVQKYHPIICDKFSSSYAASEDGAGSDEEPKVNEEEFFFAVAESTSKITIHSIR